MIPIISRLSKNANSFFFKTTMFDIGHCNHMQSVAVVYELLGNFTFSNVPLHLEQSRVDRSFKNNTARSTFSSLAYGKFKTCVHYSFKHMVAHITNIEGTLTKTVDYHPIKDKKFIVV